MRDPMRNPRLLRSHYPPCPDCGIQLQFPQDPASRMAEYYHCDKTFDPVELTRIQLFGRPPTWKDYVRDWVGVALFLFRLPYILFLRLPYILIVNLWKAREDIRTVKVLRPRSWSREGHETRKWRLENLFGMGTIFGIVIFVLWIASR